MSDSTDPCTPSGSQDSGSTAGKDIEMVPEWDDIGPVAHRMPFKTRSIGSIVSDESDYGVEELENLIRCSHCELPSLNNVKAYRKGLLLGNSPLSDLLSSNSSLRAFEEDMIRDKVHQLSGDIKALDRQIDLVDQLSAQLRSAKGDALYKTKAYEKALNSIRKTPQEIWQEIFYILLGEEQSNINPFSVITDNRARKEFLRIMKIPWTLSCVSKGWSNAVRSLPKLWTNITYFHGGPLSITSQLRRLQAQSVMAGTLPLSLTLLSCRDMSLPMSQRLARMMSALKGLSPRCHSLRICIPDSTYHILELVENFFPNLQSISIHSLDGIGYANNRPAYPRLRNPLILSALGTTKNLCSLTCFPSLILTFPDPILQQITKYSIQILPSFAITFYSTPVVIMALSRMPLLQSCAIIMGKPLPPELASPLPSRPLVLRHLKSLNVTLQEGVPIFLYLRAPSLQTIWCKSRSMSGNFLGIDCTDPEVSFLGLTTLILECDRNYTLHSRDLLMRFDTQLERETPKVRDLIEILKAAPSIQRITLNRGMSINEVKSLSKWKEDEKFTGALKELMVLYPRIPPDRSQPDKGMCMNGVVHGIDVILVSMAYFQRSIPF